MKDVTKAMIQIYNLKELGYDFMGYDFKNIKQLSFHHLIVPRKDCEAVGIGNGYLFWNGAILVQKTSHDYLHIVERIDRDRFNYITTQMITENQRNELIYECLVKISDCLDGFEREYSSLHSKKNVNAPLIKEEYTRRLIKK